MPDTDPSSDSYRKVNQPLNNFRLVALETAQNETRESYGRIHEKLDRILSEGAQTRERVTHHDGRLNSLEDDKSRATWAFLTGCVGTICGLVAVIWSFIPKGPK